jgi:hypothetical protein
MSYDYDDGRYVGRAQPRPPRDDPPTEPLILPPPHRQRPVGLILGLIAGGFILLLIGIMAGFAIRFGGGSDTGNRGAAPPAPPPVTTKAAPSPTPPADGPRAVTEKFLNAVRAGDQVTMQQQLCALLRDDNTATASPAPDPGLLFSLGTLASFKVGEEKVNVLGASVKVEMTLPLFGTSNVEVYLVREGGGWRVCGARPI